MPFQWFQRAGFVGSGGGGVSGGEPLDPTDVLESLPVGTVGSGDYAGYQVGAIIAFGKTLAEDLIRPDNLTTARIANNFSTDRDRLATSSTSVGLLISPYFTGRQDAGDGVALASQADMITIADGKMTLKVRPATTDEKAVMGDRSNASGPSFTDRRMAWAHPTLFGWGVHVGPGIMEAHIRTNSPAGAAIPANPSAIEADSSGTNWGGAIWDLDKEGGSEAVGNGTTGGEFDWYEIQARWRGNSRGSDISGSIVFLGAAPDAEMVHRIQYAPPDAVTKVRGSRRNPSTLALVGTAGETNYDDDGTGGNLAKAWETVLGVFNLTGSPSYAANFDDTAWTGKEMTMEVWSLRWWMEAGRTRAIPLIGATEVVVTQAETGSKVINLPATATIWGSGSWTESLRWAHLIDTNGPGRTDEFTAPRASSSGLPAGLTQDLSARTVTLALNTFKQPGMVMGLLYAQKSDTGWIEPWRLVIRVAPTLAIPGPTIGNGVIASTPFSFEVPRDDGAGNRYWDCGNLAFGAPGAGGLEVVSKPAWMSWDEGTRTLSGTAPGTITGLTSVTFRCTNGAGDYTEQTLDLVNPAWSPAEIDSADRAFVFDADAVPGADGDAVATVADKYVPTRTIGQANAALQPHIKVAGGPSGTMRTIEFDDDYLWSSDGANNSQLVNLFDTANFTTGGGYACTYQKTDRTAVERFFGWYSSTGGNVIGYRHTALTRGCGYNVGTARTVDQSPDAQDTSWHVIELIKVADQITVVIDGTTVATATVTDTGALDALYFLFGANRSASANAADFKGQARRGYFGAVPDGTTRGNLRTWVAA